MHEDKWFDTRDGRRLAGEVRGAGSPTVVLEAGAGSSRAMWGAVLPGLAERTRVVAYDRSGLGASPATTGPRRLADLVDDLADVVAGVGGDPVVLVAHSWGGPIVRLLADRAPERVAGLVLVDPTDEGCERFFRPAAVRRNKLLTSLLVPSARLGLLRRTPAGFAADVASARAARAELAWNVEDLAALRDRPIAPPAVPLTIITGTKPVRAQAADRADLLAAHRRAAAAAPRGRHVEAPASAHVVMATEPDLVVAEVGRLLDQISA